MDEIKIPTLGSISAIVRQVIREELSNFIIREIPHRSDEYLTKKQAAEFLKVSQSTIDNHRRSGRLRSKKAGNRVLFLRDDLVSFAEGFNQH